MGEIFLCAFGFRFVDFLFVFVVVLVVFLSDLKILAAEAPCMYKNYPSGFLISDEPSMSHCDKIANNNSIPHPKELQD